MLPGSRRLRIAAVLGLAAAAALPSGAVAAQSAAPKCDAVRGDTLGWNARWRIVMLPSGSISGPSTVIACRIGQRAEQVRVLGSFKYEDTSYGEDSESPSGGPYLQLRALQADRAVLVTRTYKPGWPTESDGTVSLVDLAIGARQELGQQLVRTGGNVIGPVRDVNTELLPSGALLLRTVMNAAPGAPDQFGPLTAWDGAGQRDLGQPEFAAPSLRRAGDSGGAYLHSGGATRREPLHGQARLTADPDPALAWQQLELTTFPASKGDGGYSAEPLTEPSTVDTGSSYGGGDLWLEYSRGSDDRRSRLQITRFAGEERIAELVRGSQREFRVLSARWGEVLAIGRFTDRPRQRRVRLLGATRRAARFFDLPASRVKAKRGTSDIVAGLKLRAYALVDGARVRYWSRGRGRLIKAPGAHDLALTSTGELFLTDRSGARLIRR